MRAEISWGVYFLPSTSSLFQSSRPARPGARADLVVLDAPSPAHLVYRPGVPLIARTVVGGETVWAAA